MPLEHVRSNNLFDDISMSDTKGVHGSGFGGMWSLTLVATTNKDRKNGLMF